MAIHARADRRHKFNRFAVCVALATPLAAHSQSAEQSAVTLPEIQVKAQTLGETTEGTGSYTTGKTKTATPLSMSLRDTPQSVSVVTQQRIEDQGLMTVTDIVNNVTGISVNQYETNRAKFTARGFDIDNLQIDGIPTTWDQAWSSGEVASSLAIYDRVEVVRGATGLMTGSGNPSAAINLVRKRADSKEFKGSAEIGVGSWGERRALIDLFTPLNQTGTVRARVVGEYKQGDSWVDLMHSKNQTVYATIEADLTPNTLLSAGFSQQDTAPKGPMWGGLPYWYTDGSKTNWDRSKTSAAGWTRWDTSYQNTFVNLEHRFDNGWKLSTSYSHGDRTGDSYLLYLSGVPDRTTGLGMNSFAGSYKTHTQQDDIGLHVSGPFELAGRKHEAAFGYMYSEQKFNSDSRAADSSAPVGDFNNWNGAAYPEPTWGAPSFYEGSITKQQALFGVVRFSLADPLKLIIGARVTNYEKTGHGVNTPEYALKNNREVTPYAGLVYDINETYSSYVSYTDIFQPQNLKDFGGKSLDPIIGKSTEAGIKGEFLDGRLNASLALFQIKQDNLGQEAGLVDRDGAGPLAPEPYYRAVKGATSNGFELDVSGELARGWNASVGYTQFKATDASGADINSVYPRQLFRVFTTYRLPGDWNALTVGGGVNWQGRTYTVDPNAPASTNGMIEQKSYSLVNLMARYEFTKQLSAQLNVNNVLDTKYFGMFPAYGALTYGAPRNATLTLKYRF
ncbi:ferric-rhodotorulic acid/ferric-coprogen receptor FhuE [Glaciimonas sp. PCH181]|uniref:ferric-rhodotorulic acid/ferric-coprogen receptor FhuE n=1 Tax=Glaciimonas sp. PCH181 TaxID=2133943 RepID=UPI000D37B159|nr:ferric-rhodotorulic acid/ferric-coprogen receptor FhuE [Glaciimonas sp. PCH181]PUA17332.1 ferric-rhodotorulic acid/ferric-coprogen receptor FhuE [Glaciimonas sp. PCH181]